MRTIAVMLILIAIAASEPARLLSQLIGHHHFSLPQGIVVVLLRIMSVLGGMQ